MSTHSIVDTAARLVGWHRSASTQEPAPTARPSDLRPSWQAAMYEDVGEFLFGNRLDPTPDNYDLAWQYRAAANARLVAAVRAELDSQGVLSADAAERIFSESAGLVTAASLAAMADRVQAQVHDVAQITAKSGVEAAQFADTLETQCSDGATPEAILQLARSMVARTRVAEAQLRHSTRELKALRATLAEAQHRADTDPLTELANRRAFKRLLEAALEKCAATKQPLSLAFCDIDRFKLLNDTHGHDVGDRVLRFVATLMTQSFGKSGTVGRFGGEEFVVMLPGLTAAAAHARVDDCREDVSERRLVSADDARRIGAITFSAGVAEARPGESMTDILRRADEALYRAKHAGRNRVELG
jgi:diguanylate cyclase